MIKLPPLPDSDGTAEANKTPHPGGGYEFDEIPAWSVTLVRAIQREAMNAALKAAANRADVMSRTDAHKAMRIADAIRALLTTTSGRNEMGLDLTLIPDTRRHSRIPMLAYTKIILGWH